MTTRIHVDAHAGWDVKVTVETRVYVPDRANIEAWSTSVEVVARNTQRDFYVHSGMRIRSIEEVPN